MIAETRHGFVCANAGVDASNVGDGLLTLLPDDPDGSAGRMRDALRDAFGVRLAVVITDTFGRPWRDGVVNVAIGCAGLPALVDLRGTLDGSGRILEATVVAFADEIAAASGLAMGKADHLPAVLIRGTAWTAPPAPARAIVRVPSDDLFRESPLQAVSMTGAAPGSGANGAHAGRDGLADALSTAVEAATASLGEDAPAVRFVPLGPSEGGPRVRVGVAVEETGTVPAEVAAGAAAQAFRIALRAQGVSSVLAAASPRPASGPPGLLESPVRVSVVVEAWRP